MCGRYTLRNHIKAQEQFKCEIRSSRFNISPGQDILTITDIPRFIKWGFTPYWADKPFNLINARSETVYEKPSFKNAGRCLIPSDGWYEWKKESDKKVPYFHHFDDEIFCFAGVFGGFRGEVGCAILTMLAPNEISHIHERAPVIIEKARHKDWLEGNLKDIYTSNMTERVQYYPVSNHVNNPQFDDETCLKKLD
ncbi:MAG: SOS response-associated peptidase [SAR86 cluster bacterium]|jgi:putative SOS response-associated peptidase YedK|nr:SOS response-associated peptidase [SAR86 cluster bacterium]